jgi:hypothetical protein
MHKATYVERGFFTKKLCKLRNYTSACTLKVDDILKVKNALVKSVYYIMNYTICNLVYMAYEIY